MAIKLRVMLQCGGYDRLRHHYALWKILAFLNHSAICGEVSARVLFDRLLEFARC